MLVCFYFLKRVSFKNVYLLFYFVASGLSCGMQVRSFVAVWEGPLEKGMAAHSSILVWRIPRTEEAGGLQHSVRHDRVMDPFTGGTLAWHVGLVVPRPVGSCPHPPKQGLSLCPCIVRQIPNHWATREGPVSSLITLIPQ